MKHVSATKPGFSIIELLAVIAIIAVLIALAIPALANARRTAKFAGSMSDTRQMMVMLSMYTTENRDTHPYIVAGQFEALHYLEPVGPNNGISPGAHMSRWNMALIADQPGILDMVYPQIDMWQTMRSRADESGDYSASVIATAARFAAPWYFSDTQPIQDHQLRATRTNEIRFPSDKMIFENWGSIWHNPQELLDSDYEGVRIRSAYGFGDGSAELLYIADLDGPYVTRSFTSRDGPGYTTTDGLAGRDR